MFLPTICELDFYGKLWFLNMFYCNIELEILSLNIFNFDFGKSEIFSRYKVQIEV